MQEANCGCEWRGYLMGLVAAELTPTSRVICQKQKKIWGAQICLEAKIKHIG